MVLFQDDDDANQTGLEGSGGKRPPVSYKFLK